MDILRFKSGLKVIFWNFKASYDVHNLAFFGLATYLATFFQKMGNHLVTLTRAKARGPYTRISLLESFMGCRNLLAFVYGQGTLTERKD